MDQNVTHVGI